MMTLRRSNFVHTLQLGSGRALVIHALSQLRLPVDADIVRLLQWFDRERAFPDSMAPLAQQMGYDEKTVAGCLAALVERGVLTEKSEEQEIAEATSALGETHDRDPAEMLERYRRAQKEGAHPYWAVAASHGVASFKYDRTRIELLLFGDCEIQMEADFLRQEAARRHIDLRVAATFASDVALAGERTCDAIVVGALDARRAVAEKSGNGPEHYVSEMRALIRKLRAQTDAPILVDNLPEPTVQPEGFADRGVDSHRNRFRRTNLVLAAMVEEFSGVYLIDVAAALGAAGTARLLDDGLTSFTHFGSPGWMLQRPESEKSAVHNIFPDLSPLAASLGGDPYGREIIIASAHMDALTTILAIDRKKCVIVDLDGTLWPGVLAETGSPFAWHPDISGAHSYIGLFFGIHEALKTLKQRGIVLVAVSKNDEQTVRGLWKYPEHYPRDRLLTPEDFVTWRVNWTDKVENIRSVAQELGFALSSFVFIDDHPVERERVQRQLPEIEVWGENLFALRRMLLADPRLQLPAATDESKNRTELVRAQLDRSKLQSSSHDERAFVDSLAIQCDVRRLRDDSQIQRVQELFARTTQFNATGRKFSAAELTGFLSSDSAAVFAMTVRDRFGDQGLVGAAVVLEGEIVGFALSCRVIGLGVERTFLDFILSDLSARHSHVTGRIVETSRNTAVRSLYRDYGFALQGSGVWQFALRVAA
ncbi:MAG: HAD-IIIC family phosphatase [Rhizomicrobium sp.]|jgi:FkbH-like protein